VLIALFATLALSFVSVPFHKFKKSDLEKAM